MGQKYRFSVLVIFVFFAVAIDDKVNSNQFIYALNSYHWFVSLRLSFLKPTFGVAASGQKIFPAGNTRNSDLKNFNFLHSWLESLIYKLDVHPSNFSKNSVDESATTFYGNLKNSITSDTNVDDESKEHLIRLVHDLLRLYPRILPTRDELQKFMDKSNLRRNHFVYVSKYAEHHTFWFFQFQQRVMLQR